MAVVLDKCGVMEEREEAAARFKEHMMAFENPVKPQDPLFNLL